MTNVTWLATLVALGVRIVLWVTQPGLTYDGTYYLRQAERLLHGDFQVVGFPPGYPLVVALLRLVVGDYELAGRLVSLAAGTATVALFHVWAERRLPAAHALVGALFLAVHPEIARTSVEVLSEPLYIACIVLGFMLLEQQRNVAAGALFGYAFLVRPEALVLLAGAALWRFWQARRTAAPGAGLALVPWRFLAIGLVPVLLYSAIATRAVGHWVLTPKQGQLDLDADVWRRLWKMATSLHVLFPWILVPGALVAGWRARSVLLVGVVYVAALPLFAIHVQPRLLQPALPILVLLGAMWMTQIRLSWRRIFVVGSAILALWGAALPARALLRPGIVTPYDKQLGAQVRRHVQFEDRVACRFPFVPYYAGAGFVNVPVASYVATMDSLVSMGATHLLVLEHEVIDMVPQLRPLYEDAAFVLAEGRLVQVTTIRPFTGPHAVLYRFQPAAFDSAAIVDRDAVAAAWVGPDLVYATRDGALRWHTTRESRAPTAALAAARGVRELCANADGTRLGLVLQENGVRQIGELVLATGELRVHAATAADAPTSPTYVGDAIVYVRGAGSGGMRVLETQRGRVRPVHFRGLRATEARPLCVTARGLEIAITYVRPQRERDEHRVVATAVWPEVAASDTAVVLAGRWATQLSLADDAVTWVPGEDRLLGSIAIRELDEDGSVVGSIASLAVFASDGRTRALSFHIEAPRRPVLGPDSVVFSSDEAVLRTAPWAAEALRFPAVRVFAAPRPEVQRRPG